MTQSRPNGLDPQISELKELVGALVEASQLQKATIDRVVDGLVVFNDHLASVDYRLDRISAAQDRITATQEQQAESLERLGQTVAQQAETTQRQADQIDRLITLADQQAAAVRILLERQGS